MTATSLGPILAATVIVPDLEQSRRAYVDGLGLREFASGTVAADFAHAMNAAMLAGQRESWLGSNAQSQPWLRLIECPGVPVRDALATHGWMALEINVADVDALAMQLDAGAFELLGGPADLDVSDRIRAMQVRGAAGEVLYLTQIRGEVPPFELPLTDASVDRLFIAVLAAADRDATLMHYAARSGRAGLCFETRLGVVNRALGMEPEQRHPVATLQLPGKSLIEIDQVQAQQPAGQALAAGVVSIRFAGSQDSNIVGNYRDGRSGRQIQVCRGAGGEVYEVDPG